MNLSVTRLALLSVLLPVATLPQVNPATPVPDLLHDTRGRQPLSVSRFEQFALASNPTLRQATLLTDQSAGRARQAGLFPNPVVGYQGEQIRGGAFSGGEQGAFVQQTFPLGGKLRLRQNFYEQERREDEIGVELQRQRILSNVRQQFYTALAAQEMVNLRRRLLGLANDARETAKQLANVGQADAPDVLEAEVETEQAQIGFINAQRQYLQEFRRLAVLAGRPELPLTTLAGELEQVPQIDANHIVDQIVANSPEVRRAQQAIVSAEAAVKSAKRESIPDLQVHAGLQNNFQPISGVNGPAVGIQGFVTAGVTVPIFNRNQGNVAAAQAEAERARLEVTRLQLSLRQSAEPAVQAYLIAQAEAQRYRDAMIPRAARAYQLYLEKYRQMGAAYPQVIVSQRTLFQLQTDYVCVLERVWTNAIALQNFLLSGGLKVPAASGNISTTVNLPSSGSNN